MKLSDLKVGAIIKSDSWTYRDENLEWIVLDHNHEGYPDNSTTLLAKDIICAKCFDAEEPSNRTGSRNEYGNNDYEVSNIRSWLNSDKQTWYTPKHGKDAPPNSSNIRDGLNPYEDEKGFMANMPKMVKDTILDTNLDYVKSTTDGGGKGNVTDKIFFLSNTEVGFAPDIDNKLEDGKAFSYFTKDPSRICKIGETATRDDKDNQRNKLSKGEDWHWWLRTPYFSYGYGSQLVNWRGGRAYENAYRGFIGVRPALNLPSRLLVIDNHDGTYSLRYNQPPTIDVKTELGTYDKSFNLVYTVNDVNEDATSVKVYLNETEILNKTSVQLAEQQTIAITKEQFAELGVGKHTIKIVATDSKNNVTTKVCNFEKVVNKTILTTQKISLENMPKLFEIQADYFIANGAELNIEVCNNAFDESPSWESCQKALTTGMKHIFANTSKTAEKWGVAIRVTLTRKNAQETSWVKKISGHIE